MTSRILRCSLPGADSDEMRDFLLGCGVCSSVSLSPSLLDPKAGNEGLADFLLCALRTSSGRDRGLSTGLETFDFRATSPGRERTFDGGLRLLAMSPGRERTLGGGREDFVTSPGRDSLLDDGLAAKGRD